MKQVYEVKVKFKNGAKTKGVFFSESEVLRYIDESLGDDYLYDVVYDWIFEIRRKVGDILQTGPLTISILEQ